MELRAYDNDLWESLRGFLSSNFPDRPWKTRRAYFDWRFGGAPWGAGLGSYLVLLDGGKVVGQLATLTDRVLVGGTWREATWIADFAVDSAYRGGLDAVRLVARATRESPLVLVSGAGLHVEKLYTALRFKKVSANRTLYLPLRPAGLVEFRTPGAIPSRVRGVLSAADTLASRGIGLLSRIAHAGASKAVRGGGVEAAMEGLFRETENANEVTMFRSSDVYRWRFANGFGARQAIFRIGSPSALRGLFVLKWFRRQDVAWVEVVDYVQSAGACRGDFAAIVDVAVREAVEAGATFVRFRASRPADLARLRRRGFVDGTRRSVDDIYVHARDPAVLAKFAAGPFHMTGLAGDRTDYGGDEWGAGNEGGGGAEGVAPGWLGPRLKASRAACGGRESHDRPKEPRVL